MRELLRGKVIVPEEPTKEMMIKFNRGCDKFAASNTNFTGEDMLMAGIKAMLQASEDQTNENT